MDKIDRSTIIMPEPFAIIKVGVHQANQFNPEIVGTAFSITSGQMITANHVLNSSWDLENHRFWVISADGQRWKEIDKGEL